MFAEVGNEKFKNTDGIIECDAFDNARMLGLVKFKAKSLDR